MGFTERTVTSGRCYTDTVCKVEWWVTKGRSVDPRSVWYTEGKGLRCDVKCSETSVSRKVEYTEKKDKED